MLNIEKKENYKILQERKHKRAIFRTVVCKSARIKFGLVSRVDKKLLRYFFLFFSPHELD